MLEVRKQSNAHSAVVGHHGVSMSLKTFDETRMFLTLFFVNTTDLLMIIFVGIG